MHCTVIYLEEKPSVYRNIPIHVYMRCQLLTVKYQQEEPATHCHIPTVATSQSPNCNIAKGVANLAAATLWD
jgi:hypothetical protein